jgi:hypothetical protein
MATPTSELVWSSRIETATPSPEKKATGKPTNRFCQVPRVIISDVGQSSARAVQPMQEPTTIPVTIQTIRDMPSVHRAVLTSFQSKITRP